jgi:anaerobic selenocysteine-containing dehydrogenase
MTTGVAQEQPTKVAVISSDAGSINAPIEISEDIMEGMVSLPYGWGHDLEGSRTTVAASRPGANSNSLASAVADAVSGNARLNAIPVTVSLNA